jgi:hypothetical protein
MATVRSVPKTEWRIFFDQLSKALIGKRAEVEVASLDLGDQVMAEWIPMVGITYEPNDDVVDVALDSINHVIRRPQQIGVDETPAGVASIAVTSGDGTKHIIRLKDPVMLPAGAR